MRTTSHVFSGLLALLYLPASRGMGGSHRETGGLGPSLESRPRRSSHRREYRLQFQLKMQLSSTSAIVQSLVVDTNGTAKVSSLASSTEGTEFWLVGGNLHVDHPTDDIAYIKFPANEAGGSSDPHCGLVGTMSFGSGLVVSACWQSTPFAFTFDGTLEFNGGQTFFVCDEDQHVSLLHLSSVNNIAHYGDRKHTDRVWPRHRSLWPNR